MRAKVSIRQWRLISHQTHFPAFLCSAAIRDTSCVRTIPSKNQHQQKSDLSTSLQLPVISLAIISQPSHLLPVTVALTTKETQTEHYTKKTNQETNKQCVSLLLAHLWQPRSRLALPLHLSHGDILRLLFIAPLRPLALLISMLALRINWLRSRQRTALLHRLQKRLVISYYAIHSQWCMVLRYHPE